jgi:hypothetical protein
VLLLAGASFIPKGEWRARAGFRWFWIGALVVAALWTLGGSTPFYHLVYAVVPGTKYFRAPSTFMYVMAFSVAVLAALGTERVLERRVGSRYLVGWIVAGVVVAALAAGGAFYNLGVGIVEGFGGGPLADRSMARLLEGKGELTLGALRSLFFTVACAGLLLAYLRARVSPTVVGWGLAALVALDLWTVERKYWQFSPPARQLFAPDPATEYLKQHAADGRVLVLAQSGEGLADRDPYFGTDGQGTGTGLMVHGIRSVTGYHGNELGRYQEISTAQTQAGPIILSPGFWRHEGVRYLYTNAQLPDSQFKRLLGPVRNSAGSTVYLYELPDVSGSAWVASAIVKAADSAIAGAVLDPRFDPRRIAAVSDTAPVEVKPLSGLPAPSDVAATVQRPTAGRIDVALAAPAPAGAALVVSENYFPGWQARIDDRPARTLRANYNLIAVPLSAGARRVTLEFRDPAYETGKIVTLLALAITLAAIVGGFVIDRRAARA